MADNLLKKEAVNWNQYKATSLFDTDRVQSMLADHVNAAVANLDPNLQLSLIHI